MQRYDQIGEYDEPLMPMEDGLFVYYDEAMVWKERALRAEEALRDETTNII